MKIGVIGCGAIAQIQHLRHLRELDDQFAIGGIGISRPGCSSTSGPNMASLPSGVSWIIATCFDPTLVCRFDRSGAHGDVVQPAEARRIGVNVSEASLNQPELTRLAAAATRLGAQLRLVVTIPGLSLTCAAALLASQPLGRLEAARPASATRRPT